MSDILKDFSKTNWRPSFYAIFYPELKAIALKYGYTLAIHGSMGRDMDVIAVPWITETGDEQKMIFEMLECVGGTMHEVHMPQADEKPHGRKVYTLPIASDRFIDVSVMPIIQILSRHKIDVACPPVKANVNYIY